MAAGPAVGPPDRCRYPRRVRWWIALGVVLAACGGAGPVAPAPGSPDVACTETFCVTYPSDWSALVGDGFVSFTHPTDPDRVLGTASETNMEGVVRNAGGTWPASVEVAAASFWALLEEAGVAELATVERLAGGSVASFGAYQDGRLWTLLIPVDSTVAVGIEVRAPNRTWQSHVDVFFSDVVVFSG